MAPAAAGPKASAGAGPPPRAGGAKVVGEGGGGGGGGPSLGESITQLLSDDQDLEFEEELARNPYRLKTWWRYLQAKEKASPRARNILHERALRFLPRSYKVWHQYLTERTKAVGECCVTDPACQVVVNTYERALVHLHKFPVIWRELCALLVKLCLGSRARHTFDRALQALPITQHKLIWPLYLQWAKDLGVKETTIRVYRRYLMLEPLQREGYVSYLEGIEHWEEAAKQLVICVNQTDFVSPKGNSKHALWMRLCDLCARNPQEVSKAINVDAIIRSGLNKFTDEVGRLWSKLADYYIRLGQFERARDVYEEAIGEVITVRDFSLIFDAYTQFEESVLSAKMQLAEAEEEEGEGGEEGDDDLDEDGNDVDLRLARLEHILERRPVLVSSVLLRQNPHNVNEWLKRADLFAEEPLKAITCYSEAVKTVQPQKVTGKLSKLWIEFANFYVKHDDLDNARVIFEKATLATYKNVGELASVWLAWAEMEMEKGNYDLARKVMQRGTTEPDVSVQRRRMTASFSRDEKRKAFANAPLQERVHKNVKMWDLFLDLEESLGSVDNAKAAYERCMDIRVATPTIVLNFTAFLEENKYFEESFKVYEKAVSLFSFPHVKPLWLKYLDGFVARYKGTKVERARDLFEQAIEKVPAKDAPEFFLRYGKFEETYGLIKKAANVYDRATERVAEGARLDMFKLYVSKVESFYGLTETRKVYEKAAEVLPDDGAREMCLLYAQMEQKLGEVDRSRALWTHGSQFADPRRHASYWKSWHDFEVGHGNEETFREMLRVKRSVQMAYSNANYMAAEMMSGEVALKSDSEAFGARGMQNREAAAAGQGELTRKRKAAEGGAKETDMDQLERQADKIRRAALEGAVEAAGEGEGETNPEEIQIDEEEEEEGMEGGGGGAAVAAVPEENPEEIDLDDMEEGEDGEQEEEKEGDIRIVTKTVPDAVFGSAKQALEKLNKEKEEDGGGGGKGAKGKSKGGKAKPKGALERMKEKKGRA